MIKATEDDASPETRFIRHVPAGSVALPNDRWMRSTTQRDFALCLDPESEFEGHLMLEGWDDHWVKVRRLTFEELVVLRDKPRNGVSDRHMVLAGTLLLKWQRVAGYDV